MKKHLHELFSALSLQFPDIPFQVDFWDGERSRYGTGIPSFTLGFKNKAAAREIIKRGSLGFGEQYVEGNIEVMGNFQKLVKMGIDPRFQEVRVSPLTKLSIATKRISSMNTLQRSRANISHHYDLGNNFYNLYLDRSMAYSCAYFRDDTDTLEDAQEQKYEHICRKLQLNKGESLLDVGCGFGGMLIYAAKKYGIRGTGCTISPNQAEYARKRIAEEGLGGRIAILEEDYRNLKDKFDKFVSIGMFEHVGKRFIPLFMKQTRNLLKPGGIGLLHTIGKEQDTPFDPWTMRYIFPGAHVPVLDHIMRTMGKEKLVPIDIENLRLHYAATLDEWARRFEQNQQKIKEMFDDKLVRMWRFYLNGSSAAFKWGEIRLYQILFTNGLNNSIPLTRDHIYRTRPGRLY
ncbi:MAG: class I SAM-dependent methyltransferase [Syntrophorhabdaceae bacterium]